MTPERLWWWSCVLHRRGLTPVARLLKLANFVLFKAILPYECDIQPDITFWHRALGVVVHPSARIGRGVTIAHGVTIAASPPGGVTVEDGVILASGCAIIPASGRDITIGSGSIIGAHALVIKDVPANTRMIAPQATVLGAEPATAD